MKTVRVPEAMSELFARAEEVVSRFFSERADDPSRGTIEIHGERYVLVRAAALSIEFFDVVRTVYGEDRRGEADELTRAILFDLSHAVGKSDARNFHQQMQLTDPVAKLSAGPVHFAHAGWAFVHIFEESHPTPDDDYCIVYDHPYSFESDAWVRAGRRSELPVCIMNAGYSSGWCEASFNQKLVAAEILCRGKGDETCRFVMAPPHHIEARIAAYLAAHPELAQRAAAFRIPDFFARKREEEALKERQYQLERELRQKQKLEALGRLTGGIAHDFNNLISVVLGQAMLAQQRVAALGDSLSSELADDLAKIVRAGERAGALTQQLLAFGRSQVSRNEKLELNEVVQDTAQMIERVIGEDVQLVLELNADAGCVNADRSQLEQVLMNLAVNARDAMPKGGCLRIATACASEGETQLTVSDTGVGMNEDVQAHMFEPFYTTKGEHGTGLGLSTVYGIVSSAGGNIEVDSRPGAGTVLRILLPRVDGHGATTVRSSVPAALRGTGTVLVAEDGSELRELLGHVLRAYGYTPLLADSAEDALRVLAEHAPAIDVLLTDVVMPRMSGVDLAARALELRPALKVLFMSGYAPDPSHRALFADNGALFLQKPFLPQELMRKLATVMGKART